MQLKSFFLALFTMLFIQQSYAQMYWDKASKEATYSDCIQDLNTNNPKLSEDEKQDFCLCYLDKLTYEYSAYDVNNMISAEWSREQKRFYQLCETSTGLQITTKNNTVEEVEAPKIGEGCNPVASSNFAAIKNSIANQSFDSDKLSTAKSIVSTNCLSAQQLKEILELFDFDDAKTELAIYAHPHCSTPNEYYLIYDVFNFDSNADIVRETIR